MADTVTVACRVPNGVILRLFEMKKRVEPVLGGGTREVEEAFQVASPVTIKGYAAEAGKAPASGAHLSMGFALTYGVNADFFSAWMEQNATHDLVVNGLIFAHGQTNSVKAMTRENEERWDGLQPMSQKGDTRMPSRDRDKVQPAAA